MASAGLGKRGENAPAELEFQHAINNFSRRRIKSALRNFWKAEYFGYDADHCGAYKWHCWMLLGEFERAWRESAAIASRGAPDPNCLWDGLPFTGKRVVIRCLHGYGDAIQFLRYARLLRRTASRVIVETHPEMVSLLTGLPSVDRVTTWGQSTTPLCREDWDQQIEVMELPRAFGTTLSTIPCEIPYLQVSKRAREQSRLALGESGKPKIGLLWASSAWNPARSLSLAELAPLLNDHRYSFYSFQRGSQAAELSGLASGYEVHDTARHSPEIADTAADLMNMDLLITVDTMAAHLAGALGRKVWVMLPWDADWRWMLDREDSPWYPTMRLFRQPSAGDWRPVVERVATELAR